jgi:hypothetical protein
MWSKLLISAVMVVFLTAVGTTVMAHNGRISNLIFDPNESDEQTWGGDHRFIDDPELVSIPIDDAFIGDGQSLFIRLTIIRSWSGLRHIIGGFLSSGNDRDSVRRGAEVTPIPEDNNGNSTDQGVRD